MAVRGRARYRNRFVRTPALEAEERAGRALWGGLMTGYLPDVDQVGPALAGTMKDLPDINVVRHGGRLLALAESAPPFALSPDLATVSRETFDGALPAGITAHPKVDPATGEMAVFCYSLEPPYLTWSMIGPDGVARRAPTAVPDVERPVMIHDMALTGRYLVLVLAPFYFDMAAAMQGGSMLSWRPDDGTRIALIPATAVRALGPDRGLLVVAQRQRLRRRRRHRRARLRPVGAPGRHDRRHRPQHRGPRPRRRRSRPRCRRADLARSGRDGVPARRRPPHRPPPRRRGPRRHRPPLELVPGDHDALCWIDTRTGSSTRWEADELSIGEPVFVPRPGDPETAHGWWVTFATNRRDLTSLLLVIPAADPASGPVARVRLPVRVPLGLHGAWLPTEE